MSASSFLRRAALRAYRAWYEAQPSTKLGVGLLVPAAASWLRFRAESREFVHVWVDPPLERWNNGAKIYLTGRETVADLMKKITNAESCEENYLAGCRARIFTSNDDNLARVVRAFCNSDPRISLWRVR